jgi:hypothetical protein
LVLQKRKSVDAACSTAVMAEAGDGGGEEKEQLGLARQTVCHVYRSKAGLPAGSLFSIFRVMIVELPPQVPQAVCTLLMSEMCAAVLFVELLSSASVAAATLVSARLRVERRGLRNTSAQGHSEGCVEAFARQNIIEELHAMKADDGERRQMLEILRRQQQAATEEADAAVAEVAAAGVSPDGIDQASGSIPFVSFSFFFPHVSPAHGC